MATLIILTPTLTTEPIPIYKDEVTPEIREIEIVKNKIDLYANKYELDKTIAHKVALCESSYIKDIVGDSGKAYGVYQFHKPTFEMFSKEFGRELDYKNTDHNIELAIWAIKNGYGNHWTCFRWLKEGKI